MPDFEHSPARDPLERLSDLAASGSLRAYGLPAEQVRALGTRRHRRRIAVTLAVASVVVVVMAGGAVAAAEQLNRTSNAPQPVDSPTPSLAPPTRPQHFTPGSRPGQGGRAFEPRLGMGALKSARGSAGAGNQATTHGIGGPGAGPAQLAVHPSPQATDETSAVPTPPLLTPTLPPPPVDSTSDPASSDPATPDQTPSDPASPEPSPPAGPTP